MSRMPGAAFVPLPRFSTGRMSAHDIVCIHTMVGSLMGTDAYFRAITTGVNSHYGTGGVGEPIRQWGDTAFRSGANLDGNGDVISIENADMGPGFLPWDTSNPDAVPPFTADQCEDIAQILAWECSTAAHAACPPSWACHQGGIPLDLIPDAKPGRRGVGYHRQGVPGFMVPGAVKWSSSPGKVCPTDRRIAQIPQILARAKQIQGGSALPDVLEDDMPTIIVQPGENVTLPTGSEKTVMDLWIACDNPLGVKGADGKVIESGAARIALQRSVAPIEWRPVADGGLAGPKADPWTVRVPLGATGSNAGTFYAASVLNVGELPFTVLLAPHKG